MAKQSLSFALETRAVAQFDDYVVDLAWSPDGKQLALAGGEGKVALAAIGGQIAIDTLGEHLLGTLALAWQPHGKRFATAGQDGAVALWDAANSRQFMRWKPGVGATQALAFGPAGDVLAAATGKSVSLWSSDGD